MEKIEQEEELVDYGITQEEYDAHVKTIQSGKAVYVNERRALTLEQLHFALDAGKPAKPEMLPPAVPNILGFQVVAENNKLRADLATASEQNAALSGELEQAKAEAEQAKAERQSAVDELLKAEDDLKLAVAERDGLAKENAELKAELEALKQAQQAPQEAAPAPVIPQGSGDIAPTNVAEILALQSSEAGQGENVAPGSAPAENSESAEAGSDAGAAAGKASKPAKG